MSPQFEKVSPVTGHLFLLSNFTVEETLLGRRHNFEYGGKKIVVKLPTKREIERHGPDPEMRVGRLGSHKKGPKGGIKDAQYELFGSELRFR